VTLPCVARMCARCPVASGASDAWRRWANESIPRLQRVHTLQYLSGTRHHGVVYRALPQQPSFFGYTDASYGNADSRKSITRHVFLAGNGAITWSSRK